MTAIEFEHVSKQYRLGLVSTKTLSHDLNRWWQTSILGKEDPYLKIGETNDRATKGNSEYVWALRDIDFKVEQGDVVGIIGKNGAGKSTLLKLLSRVTAPTTGSIRARGRIASLLEVGTGFHPEMTGRENIYLNGAILGMTKQEITSKLDEIVDFSGCERYLDTPVKRYSSGMMVRLGFAVAAHLDPEILVVDEVLAVGDAEFQKKAIGKMQDVSQSQGRTVLFVSHNMESIAKLCTSGILLENGKIKMIGDIPNVISEYISGGVDETLKDNGIIRVNESCYIENFTMSQDNIDEGMYSPGLPFEISFTAVNNSDEEAQFICNIEVKTNGAEAVTCFGNEFQTNEIIMPAHSKKQVVLHMDELLFKRGVYHLSPYFVFQTKDKYMDVYAEYYHRFEVGTPSPVYFIQPNRIWNKFPNDYVHGHLSMKVDKFEVTNIQ